MQKIASSGRQGLGLYVGVWMRVKGGLKSGIRGEGLGFLAFSIKKATLDAWNSGFRVRRV